MTRFHNDDWSRWSALSVNHLANTVWIISTITGTVIGQFIPQGAFGIDYALSAMFICLLVYQLHSMFFVATACIAAAIAVAWYLLIPGDSYIVGASMSAATIGFLIKRRTRGSHASS